VSVETDRDAELRLKVAKLTADVVDLDHQVKVLTTEVGKLLLEVRRARGAGVPQRGSDRL
jgi:hypothetical protein